MSIDLIDFSLDDIPVSPIPKNQRGWPHRHTIRVRWYYRMLRLFFVLKDAEIMHESFLKNRDPLCDYWTEHEITTILRIKKELTELYNNRFIAYRQKVAKEKGLEIGEIANTNKYILK